MKGSPASTGAEGWFWLASPVSGLQVLQLQQQAAKEGGSTHTGGQQRYQTHRIQIAGRHLVRTARMHSNSCAVHPAPPLYPKLPVCCAVCFCPLSAHKHTLTPLDQQVVQQATRAWCDTRTEPACTSAGKKGGVLMCPNCCAPPAVCAIISATVLDHSRTLL